MRDSGAIAEKLELLYPEPSLCIDSDLQAQVNTTLRNIGGALFPNFMARINRNVLVESSTATHRKSREKAIGMHSKT